MEVPNSTAKNFVGRVIEAASELPWSKPGFGLPLLHSRIHTGPRSHRRRSPGHERGRDTSGRSSGRNTSRPDGRRGTRRPEGGRGRSGRHGGRRSPRPDGGRHSRPGGGRGSGRPDGGRHSLGRSGVRRCSSRRGCGGRGCGGRHRGGRHRGRYCCSVRQTAPAILTCQVPQSCEVVEWAADDLACPLEHEIACLVDGSADRAGLSGEPAAGFGRTLVEHLVVPGDAEAAEIAGQLPAVGEDLRQCGARAGLRVGRIGRRGEIDAVEADRRGHPSRLRVARGVERGRGLRLIVAADQATVRPRRQRRHRLIAAPRIAVLQVRAARVAGRQNHAEEAAGDRAVRAYPGRQREQPVQRHRIRLRGRCRNHRDADRGGRGGEPVPGPSHAFFLRSMQLNAPGHAGPVHRNSSPRGSRRLWSG